MAYPRGPLEPFKFASPLRFVVSYDVNGEPKLPIELESRLTEVEKQLSLPWEQRISFFFSMNARNEVVH